MKFGQDVTVPRDPAMKSVPAPREQESYRGSRAWSHMLDWERGTTRVSPAPTTYEAVCHVFATAATSRGAVPSVFPDCPKYVTSQCSATKALEAKRLRRESSGLQRVLHQSAEQFQHAVEEDRIQSIKDLGDHARCDSSAFWHEVEANEHLILLDTVDEDAPSIKYSVTIKPGFSIVFHYLKATTRKLGRHISIPDVATGKKRIMEVLDAAEKWDRNVNQTDHTVSLEDSNYDLVKELHRGGLVHHSMFAVNAVAHSYAVAEELSKRDDFLTIPNQHQLATDLTVYLLTDDVPFDGCDAGHTKYVVLKHILWCSTNIFFSSTYAP
ncbi:hypothetical protein HPB48_009857 [Haemaphysalis longicornis]|uniref:Uncharacterized protein n=1 Tax=Haemaphysalis longicornis TaxID=44386 RepID=A0A9J6GLH0_HAELO|nr:hypothetical protein HPB48_009857 [Haemaphysalis longicornis]